MVISHSILEKQRKQNCQELEMKQMYREKQIRKQYQMGFRVRGFRYFCYPWVPWAISTFALETFYVHLLLSPLIVYRWFHSCFHFFFLSASHLKSGPHTLASCPGLLWHCRGGQGERAHWYQYNAPRSTHQWGSEVLLIGSLPQKSAGDLSRNKNPSPNNTAQCCISLFP